MTGREFCKARTILAIAVSLSASFSFAQTAHADLGPIVQATGNWEIHRSQDSMTDEVLCTGTLKDSPSVQLNSGKMYVIVRGGPQGYRVRVDNNAPSGMRLVNDIDRQVGAIELSQDLQTILDGHRLRLSVVTYLGERDFDLNITGATQAEDFIVTSPKCQ